MDRRKEGARSRVIAAKHMVELVRQYSLLYQCTASSLLYHRCYRLRPYYKEIDRACIRFGRVPGGNVCMRFEGVRVTKFARAAPPRSKNSVFCSCHLGPGPAPIAESRRIIMGSGHRVVAYGPRHRACRTCMMRCAVTVSTFCAVTWVGGVTRLFPKGCVGCCRLSIEGEP